MICQSIRKIISNFSVFDKGRTMDLNMAKGDMWRLETLSREMLALQASGELNNYESALMH